MRIILLGAPGSGKGTQAKLISENFNIPHISTGDIFRSNITQRTSLGMMADRFIKKGQLVPDSITISMVEDRLDKEDCSKGFILDGFPRNLNQAKSLEEILERKGKSIDKALFLDVPEYIINERIGGRQVCKSCGSSYHVKLKPSKSENKCDVCKEALVRRVDDNAEIIKNRISEYMDSIQQIFKYYGDGGPLQVINGQDEINKIYYNIIKALN